MYAILFISLLDFDFSYILKWLLNHFTHNWISLIMIGYELAKTEFLSSWHRNEFLGCIWVRPHVFFYENVISFKIQGNILWILYIENVDRKVYVSFMDLHILDGSCIDLLSILNEFDNVKNYMNYYVWLGVETGTKLVRISCWKFVSICWIY